VPSPDSRRPRWLFGVGVEPDSRFSLANERTFLAWIRTALALLAGGVALEALDLPIDAPWSRSAAIILVVLGIVAPTWAWVSWARNERSVRMSQPLPAPTGSIVLAVGVVLAGLSVLIGTLLGSSS